jgi:hypothetical protein
MLDIQLCRGEGRQTKVCCKTQVRPLSQMKKQMLGPKHGPSNIKTEKYGQWIVLTWPLHGSGFWGRHI